MKPSALLEAAKVRVTARMALLRARGDSRRNLARRGGDRVLVICHGNIYRSPFVAALLRRHAVRDVRSAGFHAVGNRPSPTRHLRMSLDMGVDLRDHRSAVVQPEDLAWADLIVLMDRANWVRLRKLGVRPEKLVWLGSLTAGPVEIPDPYDLTDESASAVLVRLREAARELATAMNAPHGD